MSSNHARIAASIVLSRLHQSAERSHVRSVTPIEPRPGESTTRLIFVRAHYRRRKGVK